MAEKICFVCGRPLTEENKSKEHILLNAAGGKLKSYDIMCKKCNADLGSKSDEALALQLRPMVNFLGVKRDNGTTPNIPLQSPDGRKYEMSDGGKPVMGEALIDFDAKTGEMRIEASTIGQARTALWNFKKAHPEYQIDVEEILKHFTNQKDYIDQLLKFDVKWGGEDAFRSIVKTALDYYTLKGYDRKHIEHLIDYILGKEKKDIVKIYYPDQTPFSYVEGEVLNLIHIEGDKASRTLFAYVVYLGCFPALILLSDHYDGDSFTETYAHDVMSHHEVQKTVVLDMTIKKFNEYHPHQGNFYTNAKIAYSYTIRTGICKQGCDETTEIVKQAFSALPEGAQIDEATIDKLRAGLMKYAKHQLNIK